MAIAWCQQLHRGQQLGMVFRYHGDELSVRPQIRLCLTALVGRSCHNNLYLESIHWRAQAMLQGRLWGNEGMYFLHCYSRGSNSLFSHREWMTCHEIIVAVYCISALFHWFSLSSNTRAPQWNYSRLEKHKEHGAGMHNGIWSGKRITLPIKNLSPIR